MVMIDYSKRAENTADYDKSRNQVRPEIIPSNSYRIQAPQKSAGGETPCLRSE